MAARRGAFVPCETNGLACPTHENPAIENIGEYRRLSNPKTPVSKKSPGALEGATGAKGNDLSIKIKHYIKDRETATALCHAILACDRADACEIMAVAFEDMSIGMPIAPLFSVMDGAGFWADLATQDELKAYTLSCFNRMSPRNQAAFLGYVRGLQ